jgi:Flp pilus assembly protein TadD
MSLLLDALKRAEAERAGKAPAPAVGGPQPAVPAPVPGPAKEAATAPAVTLELLEITQPAWSTPAPGAAAQDPLDQRKGPRRASDAGGERRTPVDAAASREEARMVFAAKAPARAARPFPLVPVLLVSGLLLLCAGAAYVWLQMRALTVPAPVARTAATSAPAPAAPPPAAPQPTAQQPTAPQVAPSLPVQGGGAASLAPAAAKPPPAVVAPAPLPRVADDVTQPVRRPAPAEREGSAVRVLPTAPRPTLDPAVSEAYAALARGDLAAARADYEAAIRRDANNLDALLGLATVAARSDNPAKAAQHYREVLAVDPQNGTARAGLAALASARATPGEGEEAYLRAELQRVGDAARAPLHTALGNLLAAGNRWTEAQAAYYEAFRLDADDPDVLYNLAVSLDHLRQARIAADFYARALKAAERRPAQFDPRLVRARLAQLG